MIRRFFARLVLVSLLGFCGYKEWQVRQLQSEVARLTAAQARNPPRKTPVLPNGWLDRAEAHADRAKNALARGDFGTARRETEQLKATMQEPQRRTQATVADARRRFNALQTDLQKLQSQAQKLSEKMSQGNTP